MRWMWCWHRGVLLALAAMLAVSGCQLGEVQPEGVLQTATAEQLASLLRTRAEATQSAKGLFRAHITGPDLFLPARVSGTVFFRRPDAMRVRGFSLFGGELFELVVSRDLYRLTLPTEGRELKGQASDLGGVAKFGRPVQLSLWAVHGALGLTTVAAEESVALNEEDGRYRLEVKGRDAGGRSRLLRRIWFERRTLLMVQEEWVGVTGDIEAVMRYEDYRSVSGAVLTAGSTVLPSPMLRPYRIVMEDGRGRGSVQLTFQEIVPNVPITSEELGAI